MTNYFQINTIENSIKNNEIETAVLFTSEGNYIAAAKGTNNQVNLADFEGFTKNAILTHNHPQGTSLSLEDIKYFMYNGLKELRAVTKEYTFSLTGKTVNAVEEFKALEAKIPTIVKQLKKEIADSIINDTDCFEDINHETIKRLFEGTQYTFTQVAN